MTKVQNLILHIVMQSGGHLTAEQVYWEAKRQLPKIALGTIYRNLNQFADSGMIRRVARAGAPDYYEGNTTPHDHVICASCGEMTDIKVPDLKAFLEERIHCDIISFDLTVNCICQNCAEKNGRKT
jgi:Fe2+ or Zn2+ uptake regulation protein